VQVAKAVPKKQPASSLASKAALKPTSSSKPAAKGGKGKKLEEDLIPKFSKEEAVAKAAEVLLSGAVIFFSI